MVAVWLAVETCKMALASNGFLFSTNKRIRESGRQNESANPVLMRKTVVNYWRELLVMS